LGSFRIVETSAISCDFLFVTFFHPFASIFDQICPFQIVKADLQIQLARAASPANCHEHRVENLTISMLDRT
jgi:hypothetical protein